MQGSFRTAPLAEQATPIRFIVTTCQAVRSVDSGPEGHHSYRQMLALDPHFFVHTGDIIYYDKAPLAKNVAEARAEWFGVDPDFPKSPVPIVRHRELL